eukprot:7885520-Prorocentrum_lima.AAC.1
MPQDIVERRVKVLCHEDINFQVTPRYKGTPNGPCHCSTCAIVARPRQPAIPLLPGARAIRALPLAVTEIKLLP